MPPFDAEHKMWGCGSTIDHNGADSIDLSAWESGAQRRSSNPQPYHGDMQNPSSAPGKTRETSRPWFKFYTRDFRDGVRVLSLEEVGAYTLILSLLYETGGRLKDDERVLCAQIGCDVRVWRRVRARLLQEGKFTATDDGFLTNERASKEIASAEHLADIRRTSGKLGGQQSGKSRAKPLGDNKPAEANASTLLDTEGRGQRADTPKEESLGDSAGDRLPLGDKPAKPPAKPKPADAAFTASEATLPVEPPPLWIERAAAKGMLNGTVAFEWGEYRQHHIDKRTKIEVLPRSYATWIANWVRNGSRQVHATSAVKVAADGRRYKDAQHNPI